MMLHMVETHHIKLTQYSLTKHGNRSDKMSKILKEMMTPLSKQSLGCVVIGDYKTMDVITQEVTKNSLSS